MAGALSRAYISDTYPNLAEDVNEFVVAAVEVHSISAFSESRQKQLQNETQKDESLPNLIKAIDSGWPEEPHSVPPEVRPYFDFREELTYIDEIVFKGERVLVPSSMHSEMPNIVHESHMGIVKCKQLARDILYWPGMNKQVEDAVSKCATCQQHRHY